MVLGVVFFKLSPYLLILQSYVRRSVKAMETVTVFEKCALKSAII